MTAKNTTYVKAQEMSDELSLGTLDLVVGAADMKAESQVYQTLSSMVSDVIKNFGAALGAAARG